jgi:hypothetical protein
VSLREKERECVCVRERESVCVCACVRKIMGDNAMREKSEQGANTKERQKGGESG